MRIPGLKTLQLSGRWLKSRLVESALILGYHRISEASQDPYSLCVTPRHFAGHLEALRKYANTISLEELVHALEERNLPRRAVVVTFDDGYADNLYEAKPLLEQYEIPATVFITTGYIGREFWWDRLEHILFFPERLPGKLCLEINNKSYKMTLGEAFKKSRKDENINLRLNFLLTLYKQLLPLSLNDREKALEHIFAWAGAPSNDDLNKRALSADEIVELAKGDLIGIGAHTITHPILEKLSKENQKQEIQQSKAYLEKILNAKVTCFSYPHGNPSEETISLVRKSAFICACSSHNDATWKGSDSFQLPRFWVCNWDRNKYKKWLMRWL
jgi:peptidoglycan/xylan/chitin deacetylase (PgdA/CDA1 family)